MKGLRPNELSPHNIFYLEKKLEHIQKAPNFRSMNEPWSIPKRPEFEKKHSGASFENFSTLLHLDEFGRTFDRNGETRNETEGYCFLKFFRMGSTILAYFRAANRESSSDLAIFPELKMSAVVLEILSSVSVSKNVGSRPGRR